jgi:hypothetical protein
MARLPRFVIPGHPQHVIVRGSSCAEIFCAEADYHFYLEKLKAVCESDGSSRQRGVAIGGRGNLCGEADQSSLTLSAT